MATTLYGRKKPSQHVTEKGRAAMKALGYKIKDENTWPCRYHAGDSVCLKDEVTKEGFDGLKSYAILVCGYAATPGDFASLIWAIAPWGASKATEIQIVSYDRLVDGPEFDRGAKIRVKKGDRITLVKVLKVRYQEWDGLFNKRPWDYKLENEREFIAGKDLKTFAWHSLSDEESAELQGQKEWFDADPYSLSSAPAEVIEKLRPSTRIR